MDNKTGFKEIEYPYNDYIAILAMECKERKGSSCTCTKTDAYKCQYDNANRKWRKVVTFFNNLPER